MKIALNISKALPKSDLGKRHTKNLAATGETLDFAASVAVKQCKEMDTLKSRV